MNQTKTHRLVKVPQMSARNLADFMAASETAKRTIVRNCKYPPIARVVQHDEAKATVAKFFTVSKSNLAMILEKAQELRDRLADDDFYRDLFDHNAAYLEKFAEVVGHLNMPTADIITPGQCPPMLLEGVKLTMDIRFRLRRVTKTNKVKIGAATLRYAKNKVLPADVAEWQSALIHGYLVATSVEDGAEAEPKLCLTVDAFGGVCHSAPTDSVSRFKHMQAACATIAERWPNVPPPPKAVF